jgi:hypothetical protein
VRGTRVSRQGAETSESACGKAARRAPTNTQSAQGHRAFSPFGQNHQCTPKPHVQRAQRQACDEDAPVRGLHLERQSCVCPPEGASLSRKRPGTAGIGCVLCGAQVVVVVRQHSQLWRVHVSRPLFWRAGAHQFLPRTSMME